MEFIEIESSPLELITRTVVLYIGILILMRVVPRRTGGELAMMDLIFVLLIAEAASHALGEFETLGDGFVVIACLIALNHLINILSYKVPFIEKLVSAPPLKVIKDGKLLRRNMRREYITHDELMEALRLRGVDDLSKVKTAYVESDGKITVIEEKKPKAQS